MSNRTQQQNLIKQLSIPLLRETTSDKFECKCIVKGCESKQNLRKAGFFWSSTKESYIYHCFKCGTTLQLNQFLKEYFRDEYLSLKVYGRELVDNHVEIPSLKIENSEIKHFIVELFKSKQIVPLKEVKDVDVWTYVKGRLIPESMYSRLYFTNNFFNINTQIKNMLNSSKQFEMREGEDKRLMWMFKTITNDVVALQGRRMDKMEPRYLISRFNSDDNRLIGGIEFININDPVYITEGYVDSLFLPNAVSLNGLHLPSIKYILDDLKCKDVVVVFDNEPDNDQIKHNIKELVEMSFNHPGLRVCLFPKELRSIGKDINDYIKSGMNQTEILNTINNNCYSGSSLKVRSVFW